MIRDGLDVLREQLDLKQIMKLIESTAMWVDRETFQYLPVWYPETARRDLMYKTNWTVPQYNTSTTTGEKVHKRVGNTSANQALTKALGLRPSDRPNWTCCHIWGIDDNSYQTSNTIVSNKRYFSCLGNMVLLPTPLKAFTDVMPDVKIMLRVAAANYYSWEPEDPNLVQLSELKDMCEWEAYPSSWPSENSAENDMRGVVKFNKVIQQFADKRKSRIYREMKEAGGFYPRDEDLRVLQYWKMDSDSV